MYTSFRDHSWLECRLSTLWRSYFSDAVSGYPIQIKFGRPARYRYGSICNKGTQCQILINSLFAHPDVPEFVIDATIVHELAHYVHGYGSGLAKLHSHPHRGGIIDKELQKRGCFFLEEAASEWRRNVWPDFYSVLAANRIAAAEAREEAANSAWDAHLDRDGFRTEDYLQNRLGALSRAFGLDRPRFEVEWLKASLQRTGLSYRFRHDKVVRLHGVLADPRVPAEVIDYELSYWLACERAGSNWSAVERTMRQAGTWESAQRAIHWRRNAWTRFRKRHHPLYSMRAAGR